MLIVLAQAAAIQEGMYLPSADVLVRSCNVADEKV